MSHEEDPVTDGSWKVNPLIPALNHIGIQDWEQLYPLIANEDSRYRLLNGALKLNEADVNGLVTATIAATPDAAKVGRAANQHYNFPLGAKKPTEDQLLSKEKLNLEKLTVSKLRSLTKLSALEALTAAPHTKIASSVNYVSQLPGVKQQGERGTCVAFAVTAINEFSFLRKKGVYTDLSEQFLYCETKNLEANGACGANISNALQVISSLGQCPESVWAYNPHLPCLQQDGQP